mmetsp:Transcript_98056/g.281756  ORF Transcript_98056/g.281756 Transcript_98056/m.281756 type:complete len:374 (+) Transcript_98056:649-1770(+)
MPSECAASSVSPVLATGCSSCPFNFHVRRHPSSPALMTKPLGAWKWRARIQPEWPSSMAATSCKALPFLLQTRNVPSRPPPTTRPVAGANCSARMPSLGLSISPSEVSCPPWNSHALNLPSMPALSTVTLLFFGLLPSAACIEKMMPRCASGMVSIGSRALMSSLQSLMAASSPALKAVFVEASYHRPLAPSGCAWSVSAMSTRSSSINFHARTSPSSPAVTTMLFGASNCMQRHQPSWARAVGGRMSRALASSRHSFSVPSAPAQSTAPAATSSSRPSSGMPQTSSGIGAGTMPPAFTCQYLIDPSMPALISRDEAVWNWMASTVRSILPAVAATIFSSPCSTFQARMKPSAPTLKSCPVPGSIRKQYILPL